MVSAFPVLSCLQHLSHVALSKQHLAPVQYHMSKREPSACNNSRQTCIDEREGFSSGGKADHSFRGCNEGMSIVTGSQLRQLKTMVMPAVMLMCTV